ncbi:uncharacterized protein LOC121049838 [Rosa chinensis]|uniref:uncharacterized protein LOC121049838 n=1 Tax=Rosa chinensis TaxID=74649 RepID=UPI001AD8C234|nr:uncharacterized protein LOC121049838 [Rosa chinensis]
MENDTNGGGAPQVSQTNETTIEAEGSVLESAPLTHGEPRVEFPDSPEAEGTDQPVEDEETEETVHPFALVVHDPVAPLPPPPPTRFERLMRVLEVTPPSAVDEAKMVLREHVGPQVLETDILPRVLEALRYLCQEKVLTQQQFSAINDLLNELDMARRCQSAANTQARDAQETLNSLSQEMDIPRGILNERAIRLRELQIQRSDFKLRIEDLQARLAFIENAIVAEEAQLDEPLAASEEMGRNLAHIRDRATQAEAGAIEAKRHVEEICLKLSFAGQSL